MQNWCIYQNICVMSPIHGLKGIKREIKKTHIRTNGFVDAQLTCGPSLYIASKFNLNINYNVSNSQSVL